MKKRFLFLFLIFAHISFAQIDKDINPISTIIEADNQLGKTRNQYCKTHTLSETILQYTNSLEALDFSNCSKDFYNAFYLHRKAWLNIIPVTNKHEHLRGEMHDLFKQIELSKDGEELKN